MPAITISNVFKAFGRSVALDGLSLDIHDGEFVTLLGPSGCGKTTTLRSLAGLEEPDSGEIVIGDRTVFAPHRGVFVPPSQRGLGLVFQSYALWPHMTVHQNVEFGLIEAKVPKPERNTRIEEILETLGLTPYQHRFPHELSGGQQQRVALARMVVVKPPVLLFDEPLSNLDAKLRMTLRAELKALHKLIGATSVYVTHDHVEALTLSDRIVVMDHGRIQQIGSPDEVYNEPANLFVAEFMGNPKANLLSAVTEGVNAQLSTGRLPLPGLGPLPNGKQVTLNIRPEDLIILRSDPSPNDGTFAAQVRAVMPAGAECLVYLHDGEGTPRSTDGDLVARGTPEQYGDLGYGQRVRLHARRGNVFDTDTSSLLGSWADPA